MVANTRLQDGWEADKSPLEMAFWCVQGLERVMP